MKVDLSSAVKFFEALPTKAKRLKTDLEEKVNLAVSKVKSVLTEIPHAINQAAKKVTKNDPDPKKITTNLDDQGRIRSVQVEKMDTISDENKRLNDKLSTLLKSRSFLDMAGIQITYQGFIGSGKNAVATINKDYDNGKIYFQVTSDKTGNIPIISVNGVLLEERGRKENLIDGINEIKVNNKIFRFNLQEL